MENENMIQFSVPPVYGVVREVRETIKKLLKGKDVSIIQKAEIVGSELLENAVKYGSPIPECLEVKFELKLVNSKIHIQVINGIIPDNHFKEFLKYFNKILEVQNTPKRQELYIERMKEILEFPDDPHSRLGLYRILYETEYKLNYSLEMDGKVLTVVAIDQ